MKRQSNMLLNLKNIAVIAFALAVSLSSCKKDSNSTGLEYAPEMYHSRAYEPLSQITDKSSEEYNSNPNNPNNMNMRVPAKGTVKRVSYNKTLGLDSEKQLLIYHINKDSFEVSGRVLKNPILKTDAILEEGKVLYGRYCQHCHGENGQGDGSVGKIYKGVPSYSKGAVKMDTEGHIFHTITFGRNRMWPHASQVSVVDRWKIVYHVQSLQNQ